MESPLWATESAGRGIENGELLPEGAEAADALCRCSHTYPQVLFYLLCYNRCAMFTKTHDR